MKFAKFEELKTENLCLRSFRESDAELFFERVGGDSEVTKYMLFEPHKSVDESRVSIRKIMARCDEGGAYTWAIVLPEDDSVIGRIDLLRFEEEESRCCFAYMIGKEFWGQGYGTEALAAVLQFAFDKMQIEEVVADHMSENSASGAVMRKVGMHFVQKHTAKYEKCGKLHDADEYKITADEWRGSC